MNFKTVLKTATFATALAFSVAGHAADAYKHEFNAGGLVIDPDGKVLNQNADFPFPVQGVGVYDLTNLANASQSFLAFCIAPTVDLLGGANYFASYNVSLTDKFGIQRGNAIKALYETSFSSLNSTESKLAFQLALWDLEVDDGVIHTGNQLLHLTADSGDAINLADGMLTSANAYLLGGGKLTTYSYTAFNTAAGALASQELLGASIAAVPEADTWAMLAVGLGLIGFVGRNRSKKSEPFAA